MGKGGKIDDNPTLLVIIDLEKDKKLVLVLAVSKVLVLVTSLIGNGGELDDSVTLLLSVDVESIPMVVLVLESSESITDELEVLDLVVS